MSAEIAAAFTCQYNATNYLLEVLLLSICLTNCNVPQPGNVPIISQEDLPRPETTIPQGTLRGINMVTRRGRSFFGFKGIPFAQPPVGDLRFRSPLPARSWNGTLDAGSNPTPCTQLVNGRIVGGEDCLYLNIYTPQLPKYENATLLPVMVYIFGGRYKVGINHPERWGPQFLLDKDVVLLVPSYRLGVLGFFSTTDEASPGNYCLKDIVLALQWIQKNIQYFGGDPKQVTIFGGSSGAVTIHYLTLSPLTQGLFHRYITQSGSVLQPIVLQDRSLTAERAIHLGEILGCPTKTSTAIVDCLRKFEATYLTVADSVSFRGGYTWIPIAEPDLPGAMFTDTATNLVAAGKIRDLPYLVSVCRDEGLVQSAKFFNDLNGFRKFLDDIDFHLPLLLRYEHLPQINITARTKALKSYYLNDPNADIRLLLGNWTQLIGDAMFTYPAWASVQQHVIHAKNPLYFCSFDYRGTVSYSYMFSGGNEDDWGVAHADELLYLLPGQPEMFGPPGYEFSDTDWHMVDTMVQLWTSFATKGVPELNTGNTIWKPYSPSEDNYLQIGNGPDASIEVKSGFHVERMKFWKKLSATT
ncbi:juvenile hormone esterase-like isoform X1 [Neodiprion virginianus]|uniref:juvenile hormone esterase-like isoform X1 n=1 Tax=Neodiprion virginianus TaxID=2961670 RepID=UPI001EE6AB44|nr:juvenile hormone esterase-like isoform X1 [Neodiprion virginianus]